MKLTTKVVFLVLLVGAIVLVTEAGIAQRSARWDAYMSQPRHKRDTSAWQDGGERATCTLQNLTADDTLGRHTSGLLSPPQNQRVCGSCWAFVAAHTYTDHLSIAAGSRTSQLSAQYLAACLRNESLVANENGCCGAIQLLAGLYFFEAMVQSQIPVHHILFVDTAQVLISKYLTQLKGSVLLPAVMERHFSQATGVFRVFKS